MGVCKPGGGKIFLNHIAEWQKGFRMKDRQEFISKIAYYSFYLALFMEVLIVLIDKSSYTNPVEGRLFQITFLLFLIKVCLTKHIKREYMVIALCLMLGAVSYLVTGRNEIIRFVMFIAACKNIDMRQCLKRVFWLTLSGCLVIMLLAVTGIYGAVSLTQNYGHGMVETRYTLGLGHPNALQCMVWALTTLWLYLFCEKMKWYHYVIGLMLNLGFFALTRSKTGLMAAVLAVFVFWCVQHIKSDLWKRFSGMLAVVVYVACVLVSVMAAKDAMCIWRLHCEGIYEPKVDFYLVLDKLLTGRIASLIEPVNHAGTMQTWSLWSSPDSNYYFDMGWVRLFYWYGIIPATIIVILLLLFMIALCKRRKPEAVAMIMIFSVYTVVEAHAVSVYLARNYVLFLIGAYWCEMIKREKIT